MSLTHETFRGGGDTNDGAGLSGGETRQLIPHSGDASDPGGRWCLFFPSGGAGNVILKLPNAKGLPLGTTFHILFTSASQDTQLQMYSGAVQAIFDRGGVSRTVIDFTSPDWGVDAGAAASCGIEVRLLVNTTSNGLWTAYYWSDY
jgi:hypothetical protein